jgi:hypothetical protein
LDGQRHAPAALTPLPGKRAGTQCIAGWVGPRAGLDLYSLNVHKILQFQRNAIKVFINSLPYKKVTILAGVLNAFG